MEVRTSDGRRLDVRVAGPSGIPLVLHHGTPGANRQFALWVAAAQSRGLKVVSYSRPGYGRSDRAKGRTVGDCAADVAAILDELGDHRFLTIGPSGGGPHALAVAALLPQRTMACATVGSLGMFGMADLDFFAAMGRNLVTTYRMGGARNETGLVRFVEDYRQRLLGSPIAVLFDTDRMPLAPVDADAMSGPLGKYLLDDAREALRTGVCGWVDDALAFTQPWGFDLGVIEVPVTVWQGAQDRMVPPAHGAWLAAHIPGATAEFRAEHGHMSLAVDGFGEVLDRLIRAADVSGLARA